MIGAVKLIQARDEFLQRSGAPAALQLPAPCFLLQRTPAVLTLAGADRARTLATLSKAGAEQLVREGAVPLLLRLSTGSAEQVLI